MRLAALLLCGALTLAACGGGSDERSDADRVRDTLGAFGEASAQHDYRRVCADLLAKPVIDSVRKAGLSCESAMKTALDGVQAPEDRGPSGDHQGRPRERQGAHAPPPTSSRPTTRSRWSGRATTGRSALWAGSSRRRQPGAAARNVASTSVLAIGPDTRGVGAGVLVARRGRRARRRASRWRTARRGSARRSRPACPRRHRRGGLVVGGDVVAEARALEHRAVEGQAEVGQQVAPHRGVRGGGVVDHGRRARRPPPSKPSSVLPARSRPARSSGTTTARMYCGLHSQSIAPSATSPARRSIAGDSAAM